LNKIIASAASLPFLVAPKKSAPILA